MKILFTVILIFISTVCWSYEAKQAKGNSHVIYKLNSPQYGQYELVKFPNGLSCVSIDVGRGGGVTCNWEAYNKRQEKKKTK